MDPRFVLFVIVIIVIVCFVPTHSTENFTDRIRPTWGCPSGGHLMNNNIWCSQQNTAAGPSNTCPNGYFYDKRLCTKQAYAPSSFCPARYKFIRNGRWCIN